MTCESHMSRHFGLDFINFGDAFFDGFPNTLLLQRDINVIFVPMCSYVCFRSL